MRGVLGEGRLPRQEMTEIMKKNLAMDAIGARQRMLHSHAAVLAAWQEGSCRQGKTECQDAGVR